MITKKKPTQQGQRRNRSSFDDSRKEDFIYFEDAVITEALPGTSFRVKVKRTSQDPNVVLPDIQLVCSLKSKLIKRRVRVIKGDSVVVEVNPEDMYYNLNDTSILKGAIIQRKT